MPDVSSLNHAGVRMPSMAVWMGLVAPEGIPLDVSSKLSRELLKALASKDVQEKLLAAGLLADGSSPEGLRSFMARDPPAGAL